MAALTTVKINLLKSVSDTPTTPIGWSIPGDVPWNESKNAIRPRKAHDGLAHDEVSIVFRRAIQDWDTLLLTRQMYSEKSKPAV